MAPLRIAACVMVCSCSSGRGSGDSVAAGPIYSPGLGEPGYPDVL